MTTDNPLHGNAGGNRPNLTYREMELIVEYVRESMRKRWISLKQVQERTGVDYGLLRTVKKRLEAGEKPFRRPPIESDRKPFSEHLNRIPKPKPTPPPEELVNPEPVSIGQAIEGATHVDDVARMLEDMKRELEKDMAPAVKVRAIAEAIDTLKKMGVHEEVGPPKPKTPDEARARLRIIRDCVGVEMFREIANERVA